MPGIESMIAQAEKSLGIGEPNYIQVWYNSGLTGNWSWCDGAISYWGNKSGNGAVIGKFAYTVAHANWFKGKGQWHVDVAGIKRGDIVFFDWGFSNSIGAIDHVGVVTGRASGGRILTIEGNTSNVCARRVRYAKTIVGYGRPAYSGAPKPSPPGAYAPPRFPSPALRPNSSSPSAKSLQRALKAANYMAESVVLSNNYGPATQAAVKRFYAVNKQFGYAGVQIGPGGWRELHREAYA